MEKKINKAKADARLQMESNESPSTIGATDSDKALAAAISKAKAAGEIWKPQHYGDTVIGSLLSLSRDDGQYGVQIKLILGIEGGALTIYCNSSMNRSLIMAGVNIGDRIAIKYADDSAGTRGKPMRLFAIVNAKKDSIQSADLTKLIESVIKESIENSKAKGKKGKK